MLKRIVLAVLGILALCIAAISSLFPQQAKFIVAMIWSNLVANSGPPAIAEGHITNKDWLHWEDASKKFTAILVRKFPAGTSETVLKSTLLAQGFEAPSPPSPALIVGCIPEGKPKPVGRSYTLCPNWDVKRTLEYDWGGLPAASMYRFLGWPTLKTGLHI
jgi:hypothetical protein